MPETHTTQTSHVETIIVGGSQAGLSVGYQLARRGRPFLILDAQDRVGDAWRKRWDSLLLFTPARYNGLPGMKFPAPGGTFVNKDQMADFLEAYAERFELPIRTSARVERLTERAEGFALHVGGKVYTADNVIVAMANYQQPKRPPFAQQLSADIVQLHSADYKNPEQLAPGEVLVVGTGNSGADIARELAPHRQVWLSGSDGAEIPFRVETRIGNHVGIRMVRLLGHFILNTNTPAGRKLRPKVKKMAAPRVRVKMQDLLDAGVKRVARVAGVRNGLPLLEDGRVLDVQNVIWCTGFTAGFSWIDLPIFDPGCAEPRHERGVVKERPGLYFVGLHFQHAATSATVTGVHRDASYVVQHLHQRMQAIRPQLPSARPVHSSVAMKRL